MAKNSYMCSRCIYYNIPRICDTCACGKNFVERSIKNAVWTMAFPKVPNKRCISNRNKIDGSRLSIGHVGQHITSRYIPEIKDVIFNDLATIVFWTDGSKTVVKCCEDDIFDPEKGLAMAIAKKALGNKGRYYENFKKWLPDEDGCETVESSTILNKRCYDAFDNALNALSVSLRNRRPVIW